LVNRSTANSSGKPGLYASDPDGKKMKYLGETILSHRDFARTDNFTNQAGYEYYYSSQELSRQDNDTVQITLLDGDFSELARIQSRTGEMTALDAPENCIACLRDGRGVVRVAVTADRDSHVVSYRASISDSWRELARFAPGSPNEFIPKIFADERLYVSAHNGRDKSAIFLYDLNKNAVAAEPLIASPDYDVRGKFLVDDKRVLGFRFDTDAEITVWFDSQMKAIQQEIDTLLPSTINNIERGARSETPYVLVEAYSDVQPPLYLIFDTASKKLTRIGAMYPQIDAAKMAPMQAVTYPARDGLAIPAYLTVPPGGNKKNLGLVVLIGEQSWRRNGRWKWNSEAQFLASRGYAVLQPDTRGSTGYGMRLYQAGWKQWGLAMQNDIADGVKWATAQGIADPKRVCALGTGYGGFAAVSALATHPDAVKCAVSWSGIVDISKMFDRDWPNYGKPDAGYEVVVGSPHRDAAQFQATSIASIADRIKSPVLMAYGKDDKRIPMSEGRAVFEKIAQGNPKAEWYQGNGQEQDWSLQENRIEFWSKVSEFLDKSIGQ